MFRLASHLHMTVGELEVRMTSRELAEWQAYFNVDPPFEPWIAHADLAFGLYAPYSKDKTLSRSAFLPPQLRPKKRVMTQAEIRAVMGQHARNRPGAGG